MAVKKRKSTSTTNKNWSTANNWEPVESAPTGTTGVEFTSTSDTTQLSAGGNCAFLDMLNFKKAFLFKTNSLSVGSTEAGNPESTELSAGIFVGLRIGTGTTEFNISEAGALLKFKDVSGKTLAFVTNGFTLPELLLETASGKLIFEDNVKAKNLEFTKGTTLKLNGKLLEIEKFLYKNSTAGGATLDWAKGKIKITGTGTVFTLEGTATLTQTGVEEATVEVTNSSETEKKLEFEKGNQAEVEYGTLAISGDNVAFLGTAKCKKVVFTSPAGGQPNGIKIQSGLNGLVVGETFESNGTLGNHVKVLASTPGTAALLKVPNKSKAEYTDFKDITIPEGTLYAGPNCKNEGNNSGIVFTRELPLLI